MGAANWETGFSTAFNQISATTPTTNVPLGCNTVFVFFTAGRGSGAVESTFKTRNTINARVLSYGLGPNINLDLLKALACSSGGVFRQLPASSSTEDVVAAALDYYVYLQLGYANSLPVSWSESLPFSDLTGNSSQRFSTASLACYDGTRFIGVVSATVPASMASPVASAGVCQNFTLAAGDLERLRGDQLCTGSPSLAIGLGIGGAFVFLVIVLGCLGCCGYFDIVLGVFYGILLLVQFPIMIALPWRPIFMFTGVFCGRSQPTLKRGAGKAFLHLGLFFLDLVTLPAFFITLFLLIDAPYMFSKMFKGNLYKKTQSAKAHWHIWAAFLMSWRDAFIFYLLLPLTLLMPWRFCFVVWDCIFSADSASDRRRIISAQFGLMVADLATVPFFAIAFLISPWRWYAVYRDFKGIFEDGDPQLVVCAGSGGGATSAYRRRHTVAFFFAMWKHIASVFVDMLLLPFLAATLVVPVRFIAVAASFALIRHDAVSRWKILVIQAWLTLLDLLCLPAAAIIFATLYRLPSFRRSLIGLAQEQNVGQYFLSDAERAAGTWLRVSFSPRVHILIWREGLQVLVDIVVLFLWILTWIAPWRAIIALLDVAVRESHQGGRRVAVIKQFCNAYLDLASFIPALLQLVTVYRVKGILAEIVVETTAWHSQVFNFPLTAADPARGGYFWSDRALAVRYTTHIHRVVWKNFGVFCVDLLCLFAGPLTFAFPWRGYWFARDVYLAGEARHRRLAAFVNLALMFLDFVTLPFFLIVLITLYRIPSLIRNWKQVATDVRTSVGWGSWIRPPNADEAMYRLFHSPMFHAKLVIQAGHVALDMIVVLVGLLTIVMPWRFVILVYSVVTAGRVPPGTQPTTPGWKLHYRRMAPLIQFSLALLDLLCLPFFLPVIVTIFRLVIAVRLWKSEVMQKPDSIAVWGHKNIRVRLLRHVSFVADDFSSALDSRSI